MDVEKPFGQKLEAVFAINRETPSKDGQSLTPSCRDTQFRQHRVMAINNDASQMPQADGLMKSRGHLEREMATNRARADQHCCRILQAFALIDGVFACEFHSLSYHNMHAWTDTCQLMHALPLSHMNSTTKSNTSTNTHTHTHRQQHTHTHTHTITSAHTHTHTHARTRKHINTHAHTTTNANTQAHNHTSIRAQKHRNTKRGNIITEAQIQTRKRTNKHASTQTQKNRNTETGLLKRYILRI